ncbi:MAG: hypothetical protein LBF60_05160 [Treponema sp.]|jgi:hypothetical protein|nr:hypothetical protein [Treponema sp.]
MVKKTMLFGLGAFAAALVASCSFFDFETPVDSTLPPDKEIAIDGNTPVSKIDFSDVSGSVSISIDSLTNKSVYLVKYAAASAAAGQTGSAVANEYSAQPSAASPERSAASGVFTAGDGSASVRYDHLAAQRFNRSPPPESGGGVRAAAEEARAAYKVYTEDGLTGQFWVEAGSSGNSWIRESAVLRAASEHAAVWVADKNFTQTESASNDNKITQAQAEEIAVRFDAIYQKETPIFGYEYGGGPGGDGGRDGDPKIQILVYDIDGDYKRNQTSGVFGYFWAKDFYTQAEAGKTKSNAAEIFYLDAHFADKHPDGAISTLAHEFQHMINFNEKSVKSDFKQSSETWFDEMLAMLAEDLIDPLVGVVESEFPYNQRIPLFLNGYSDCAPTTWMEGEKALYSYANSYAFGAYLIRNFGGARLVKEMMTNSKVNEESVVDAVNAMSPAAAPATAERGGGWNFSDLLSRYGEALIFSGNEKPSGVFSFDNTVTEIIDGTEYTCAGFDIWGMDNPFAGKKLSSQYSMVYPSKGPLIIDTGYAIGMFENTFIVQSNAAWRNKTGNVTMRLNKPASSAVAFFIMIK